MNTMRASILLLLVIATGCSRAPKSFDELTADQQLADSRAQTESAVKEGCTNEVPGIHSFVNIFVDDSSEALVKWRAQAEFDYVNHLGGIDRTNLHFVFIRAYSGRLSALTDEDYYQEQWRKREAAIGRDATGN